jgi:hypothetical protein
VKKIKEYLKALIRKLFPPVRPISEQPEPEEIENKANREKRKAHVVMRFKDLPKGARFRYPDDTRVWVALETHGNGLVAKWEGLNSGGRQPLCSFVDDEYSLESEVHAINE